MAGFLDERLRNNFFFNIPGLFIHVPYPARLLFIFFYRTLFRCLDSYSIGSLLNCNTIFLDVYRSSLDDGMGGSILGHWE